MNVKISGENNLYNYNHINWSKDFHNTSVNWINVNELKKDKVCPEGILILVMIFKFRNLSFPNVE